MGFREVICPECGGTDTATGASKDDIGKNLFYLERGRGPLEELYLLGKIEVQEALAAPETELLVCFDCLRSFQVSRVYISEHHQKEVETPQWGCTR